MLEVYCAMALAGYFICSITGIDSMSGFHPSLDAILEELGYATPPIMALLFILDKVIKIGIGRFDGFDDGFLVYCGANWKGNQFVVPTTFACCVSKNTKGIYSEMVEKLYDRIGVNKDIFELKITSQLTGISLVINADDEVNFVLMHNKSEWPEIHVEVVDNSVHQTPRNARNTTINLECTPPPFTPTNNLHSPAVSEALEVDDIAEDILKLTLENSPGNNQGTPASTNKHAEVDDTYDFETSDTENESGTEGDTSKDPNGVSKVSQCGGQAKTDSKETPTDGVEERGGGSGAPNSSAPSMTSRWTILGSELYSIQPIQLKDLFEDQCDQGQIYK
ncbi:hypothetical protein Dsin_002484 [Dipteronia sinensis]|uniref:Uncharacterized protein n=1 Tax=Dipteronia sinensis TaxID=43782 RepID=A0AAE0EJB1_9ROSI|nr:hypothetical protein Dsin_002484 [Dipteronia sinensis]